MKFLTKAIERQLPPLDSQDGKGDAGIAYVKFFSIRSDHRWFGMEYDPETQTFFGIVTNRGEMEYGYFSAEELQSQRWAGIPIVERDLHFKPTTVADIKREYANG